MKRMERAAQKQGRSDMFKTIRKDEKRAHQLLQKYHLECGPAGDSGRLPAWDWAQYEEYEKTEFQTRLRRIATMMTEERYLEYAASAAGGLLRAHEAKAKRVFLFALCLFFFLILVSQKLVRLVGPVPGRLLGGFWQGSGRLLGSIWEASGRVLGSMWDVGGFWAGKVLVSSGGL